jgi:hypothetical protein
MFDDDGISKEGYERKRRRQLAAGCPWARKAIQAK